MKPHVVWNRCAIAVTVLSALTVRAGAEPYSFVESFNAPPLTPGTDAGFYEDGWNNGDNGWIVSEAGAAQWGQRSGVGGSWPGGADSAVGTIRHRDTQSVSFVARSLAAIGQPLSSGNLTIKMQNILIYGSRTELTFFDGRERATALTLRFGESGINQDALEVAQVGGAGTTVTTASNHIQWTTQGLSANTGRYGMLSIDFNAASDQATVTVSSVAPSGAITSAPPVKVNFERPVSSIGQVRLTSAMPPNSGQPGSLLWLGEFALNGQVAPANTSSFGRDWTRSHEFQIMGAALGGSPSFSTSDYVGAGFTTVFANNSYAVAAAAADAGLPWMMHEAGPRPYQAYTPGEQILINNAIDRGLHPGKGAAIGWMLPDEPVSQAEIDALAQSSQWLKQNHPDLPVMVSVFQNDAPTLNNIITTIKPDIVIFDFYPFRNDGSTEASQWFQTLMAVRSASKAANLPYWGWMQGFMYAGGAYNRVPSESDNRYNAFTLLTAGYTGLNYLSYDHDTGGGSSSTFFDANGNKTGFYYYARTMHEEVKRIGKTLRFLDSTDVRFVRGANVSTPSGLTDWTPGAGNDPAILSISVAGTPTLGKDALVGYFTDDAGQKYLMLTNLYHAAGASAASMASTITVTFNAAINELLRLNRLSGEPEKLVLSNHTLNLTLPGGTGDLLKYSIGGFFAGIPGGDASLDGTVDVIDLGLLATNWQMPGTWKNGDFNLDGVINVVDLGILATHWQEGVSVSAAGQSLAEALASLGLPGTTVPEPTLALLAAPIALVLGIRRNTERAR